MERVFLWSRSISEIKSSDLILAGYPKTGSTWIRFYLYSLLCQRAPELPQTIDAMNDAMPEFANRSYFKGWHFEETPRIVKTHQKRLRVFRRNKAALVVRDPRDIVVSYYHYVSGLKASGFDGKVSDVLRDRKMGAEAFFKHYSSWEDSAGLILRYEDIKEDPYTSFSKLAEFFSIDRTEAEIRVAIEAANFSNMRLAQSKSVNLKAEFKEGHQFVRSGRNAQWADLFSEDDIEYYESLKTKYSFDLYG